MSKICFIAAVVLFLLAAFGVSASFSLVDVGLAVGFAGFAVG